MSPRTRHDSHAADPRDQLARLFDLPQLARIVPHLAPDVLHQLIRHAGIERCVDIVEAATPEQLTTILDLDLWAPVVAGSDDQFDASRFGEWIESLVDRDAETAARIVARFERPLVIAGLSRYLRVIDPGTLEPTAQSDDEPWEATAETEAAARARAGTTADLGGYLLQARRPDAWDAMVAMLQALCEAQPAVFHAVMRGCRQLSDSGRELDGLDDLLDQPAQALYDLSGDRDDRRTAQGFSTAAEARAFLALARQPRATEGGSSSGRNAVAAAFFRDRDGAAEHPPDSSSTSPPMPGPARAETMSPELSAALDEAVRVLTAEGLVAGGAPAAPRALLGTRASDHHPHPTPARLEALLAYLGDHQPDTLLVRGQELAFLANALVAGCSLSGRAFTPQEAAEAAAATCDLGLLLLSTPPDAAYLGAHDLISMFELGWSTLHRDVSLSVAQQLLTGLTGLQGTGSDTLKGLRELRRSLKTHIRSGTPWLVEEALDVLSTLDTPAWYGLVGLLSECPVVPAIVTAIVERDTGRIDPKAFAFISTPAQIETVRQFMARVPQLLRG